MIKIIDLDEKDKNGNPTVNPYEDGERGIEEGLLKLIEQVKYKAEKDIYQSMYTQMEVWNTLANISADDTKEKSVEKGRANALALVIKDDYLSEEQKQLKSQIAAMTFN